MLNSERSERASERTCVLCGCHICDKNLTRGGASPSLNTISTLYIPPRYNKSAQLHLCIVACIGVEWLPPKLFRNFEKKNTETHTSHIPHTSHTPPIFPNSHLYVPLFSDSILPLHFLFTAVIFNDISTNFADKLYSLDVMYNDNDNYQRFNDSCMYTHHTHTHTHIIHVMCVHVCVYVVYFCERTTDITHARQTRTENITHTTLPSHMFSPKMKRHAHIHALSHTTQTKRVK